MAKSTTIRKGMPSVQLSKAEFSDRLRGRFYDPAFAEVAEEIERNLEHFLIIKEKHLTDYLAQIA